MSTTRQVHARIARKIINHDAGGAFLVCCWDECDRDSYELYKIRQHEHLRHVPCEAVDQGLYPGKHITFTFCTERHRQFFVNATGGNALESIARTGVAHGNLPAGMRGMIG